MRQTHISSQRGDSPVALSMFFSLLPILSTVAVICFGVGMSAIAFLLAENQYILALACFLFCVFIASQTLAPLAYRFFIRALPLRASGDVYVSFLRILQGVRALILVALLGVLAWAWQLALSLIKPTGGIIEQVLGAVGDYILLTFCSMILLFLICLAYGLTKAIGLHCRPTNWAQASFVLFLRSFGSVSDSAVLGALVKGAGRSARVVLLASPKELNSSWDPMTLVASGLNFRRPFRSAPVYLESTDDSWQDDIRRLSREAVAVVIDVSHATPGLSQEIAILEQSASLESIIAIEEAQTDGVTRKNYNIRRAEPLSMTKSLTKRHLSQAVAFTFTYLGFVILTALGVSVADPYWSSKAGSVILWASLLFSALPGAWVASTFAPAAGFTRQSSAALAHAISRKVTSSSISVGTGGESTSRA